ncbi:MAG TPA: FtsQ-type POTRA domain-containing protein [Pyrinomonadaceae bacterium]|nr:FtsQ-type POTRA domain-containing protein [Pyrinomonadaceae bacterium]
MKEQVITPRAAGRSVGTGKGRSGEMVQRPARRDRGLSASRARSSGLQRMLAYLPLAGKIGLAVVIGVLIFAGYRAAASASFFQARNVDVSGTSRASADDIKAIVMRGVAQTGVWRADLDAISKELKTVAWVRDAVVSRVLPDGLRVRVTEREPRAIVRTSSGKFLSVDNEAFNLGAASPTDQIFMRGWNEDGSEAARAENRERVQKFLEMTRDWETKGISRRVSEVNLDDMRDVRVQLTGEDSLIEIQLGKEDFGRRLESALMTLDKQRSTPIGPFILHVNVAQGVEGKSAIIGLSQDAPNFSSASHEEGTPEFESVKANARSVTKPVPESRKAKEKVARKDEEQARKKEQDKKEKSKKEKASPEAKTESRPRRVG